MPTRYTVSSDTTVGVDPAAELQIANGRSSIVVGEVEIGGHPFGLSRYARTGYTTVLTLEANANISNAVGVTGTLRLYDGGGVLKATLTWSGAPGVAGSTQTVGVSLPVADTVYTATMDVVGGDGLLDTMNVISAALIVTHT
jgi:hypothetical protein